MNVLEKCHKSECETGKGEGMEGMEGKLNGNHLRMSSIQRLTKGLMDFGVVFRQMVAIFNNFFVVCSSLYQLESIYLYFPPSSQLLYFSVLLLLNWK